jgi:hypothetical protein
MLAPIPRILGNTLLIPTALIFFVRSSSVNCGSIENQEAWLLGFAAKLQSRWEIGQGSVPRAVVTSSGRCCL